MLCGGVNPEMPADKNIQEICDKMKSYVENHAGKKYSVFKAKTYRTQPVAGTNYFVKVHVGGEEYVHLQIFEPLTCNGGEITLSKVNKQKRTYFERF
uniref:Cystatin-B n=1 Tax=Cynoglossus semilaevis TaxID=244447 RepID=A0A3P8WGQ1_CYNSE